MHKFKSSRERVQTTHLWKQSVYTEALQLHKSSSKNKSSNGSWDIVLFIFSRDDVMHAEGISFIFQKWIHFLSGRLNDISSEWTECDL